MARGAASAILSLIDADGVNRYWREELNRVEPGALDALSRLLLSVALQRKIRRRDFNGIRELLLLGHDAGLTNTPVCSQAAELLERLTTFASITRGSAGACEATA